MKLSLGISMCVRGALLAALVAAAPAFAQTDIYLRTERAGRGKVPIVVKEIEAASAKERSAASLIAEVIRNDLDYSGLFETLGAEAANGSSEGGRTAGAVFEGRLSSEGGSYLLDAALVDFSSKETIFSKRYQFGDDAKRVVAHRVSDEIVYFLIGERGIATTRVLFRRAQGDYKNLYVVDYDGFGERAITKEEIVISPLWLDGSRFCYTSDRRQNWDCYIVDLAKGTKYLMTQWRGINLAGSYFGPRGELAMTLSVNGNHEIYVLDTSGKILRRLTRNRAIDISPSWSPNGSEIAFVSDRGGTPQIYIMDSYGGNVRRLTRIGSYNQSPAWSPNGDLIAYSSREGNQYRLKIISPDGLVEEILFDDNMSYEDPCWAPDGRHIAATVREGGANYIVVVDIDTKEKRRLTRGEFADWSPLPAVHAGAASNR
jgi:TolB protein